MNRRRIIDDQLYAHFVTFCCDRRRQLLSLDHPKKIVLGVLNQELERIDGKCVGYVIMPDHVHAIVWFPETGRLSGFMHEWKRLSSRRIREWYAEQDMNYFRACEAGDRLWQPKYHAFELETERKIEEKLEYMHLNPVRKGLVERAVDWCWSSARWYYLHKPVGVPIAWVE